LLTLHLGVRIDLLMPAQRQVAHALGLLAVDREAALQALDRVVAQVMAARAVARQQAVMQVDDHALAQRALGRQQRVNAEMRGQRVENGQAAGQHGLAFGLQAGQRDALGRAGGDAFADQPAQAFGRDAAIGLATGSEHFRHGACRARRAERLLPAAGHEIGHRLFQLGAGCHLGHAEGLGGVAPVGEVAHRQADAADLEGLGLLGLAARAQDHLGGAAADVDHQPAYVGGLQVRDAGVDQARLFAARDHLDRMAERRLRALQEGIAVARLAQGLRRHGAHLCGGEACQAFAEALQAGQPAQRGFLGQHAFGVQAGAQAHGLFQIELPAVAAVAQLADFEPEAVRPHVDRGQQAGRGRQS
jgi:hypothetical protein